MSKSRKSGRKPEDSANKVDSVYHHSGHTKEVTDSFLLPGSLKLPWSLHLLSLVLKSFQFHGLSHSPPINLRVSFCCLWTENSDRPTL